MSSEALAGMLDDELARAIERIHERMRELDRDLAFLKEERDRRARERRQRELDQCDEGAPFADEEYDT
jgi:hypothetical protein